MSHKNITAYAPDIYNALHGILLVCKPPRTLSRELSRDLRGRISDQLNKYQPRPLSNRVCIEGSLDEEKRIVEKPNLADHPLVVGPRYVPWELTIQQIQCLGFRSSGVSTFLFGRANRLAATMKRHKFINIYQLGGRLGHATDTHFYDGKVMDKCTFHHITPSRIDKVLARIEAIQYERLFDAANVEQGSEEAYQLAKAWPSKPPRMASWPVIYRIRCIHFEPPLFKLEVTVTNETEKFLAQITNDVGLMLKSAAFTESIRRVKHGIFDIEDSLTEKDYDMQSIINNLALHNARMDEIKEYLREHSRAFKITTTSRQEESLKSQRHSQ